MFILIFSIKNICTVSLLSIKRHAVLGHFYLTFIPLCIYYLYGWNLFNIVCIWIFLSVRCVINFETGLYVTSTVTCWFSRWRYYLLQNNMQKTDLLKSVFPQLRLKIRAVKLKDSPPSAHLFIISYVIFLSFYWFDNYILLWWRSDHVFIVNETQ